ncbi:hypothetical protein C3408_19095 [Candidatus Pantoea alvi]|uniref:hypothetical protein n=1 Tax=Enterobacter agglomerans TaxID=549 RepID=UPI000CDDD650|nr:hypothetical protein [Pantoea agglomerans]POW55313.1 hypothetical protein C3408_19095 [Pantoea alvi]
MPWSSHHAGEAAQNKTAKKGHYFLLKGIYKMMEISAEPALPAGFFLFLQRENKRLPAIALYEI